MKGQPMSIRRAAVAGALAGAVVAILLALMEWLQPFSPLVPWDQLTLVLCPLYILVAFMNIVHTMSGVIAIAIIGNMLIYGALAAMVVAGLGAIRLLAGTTMRWWHRGE